MRDYKIMREVDFLCATLPFKDLRGLDFGLGFGESPALLFEVISAMRLERGSTNKINFYIKLIHSQNSFSFTVTFWCTKDVLQQ